MSDFPSTLSVPMRGVIHSGASEASLLYEAGKLSGTSWATGAVWPASNRAIYMPFMVEQPVTAYQMAFEVVTQSGNYDVGLYTEQGVRLVSKGSTAVPAAGLATADITDTLLNPGVYYMAMSVDNTTASIVRSTSAALYLQVCGAQQQDIGAVTLPDPATFANPAAAYFPGVSVALKSTI